MEQNQLLILSGREVDEILKGREIEMLESVAAAYQIHAKGDSEMPPNSWLQIPGLGQERIIAKAAYLGGDFPTTGLKWIGAFPNNVALGLEKASAAFILNCSRTGHPTAILENSIISAKCTAASAALAAQMMYPHQLLGSVGLVGCGSVNFETLRFLLAIYPELQAVHLLDDDPTQAQQFRQKALRLNATLDIYTATQFNELLDRAPVIAFATTAMQPFIYSIDIVQRHTVFLHTSLRDLGPNIIMAADNVVDDIEQICSNDTSVHDVEKSLGHRDFIRTTIGEMLNGVVAPYAPDNYLHIFSPYGLGILDLALAELVVEKAKKLDG